MTTTARSDKTREVLKIKRSERTREVLDEIMDELTSDTEEVLVLTVLGLQFLREISDTLSTIQKR